MKNVLFISLGCDKNLVDSEKMLGLLKEGGCRIVDDEGEADAVIVNTCCFIHDAKEESIETLLMMAEWKKNAGPRDKALIVAGCMAQRYQEEIREEIPEVDAVIGTNGYPEIVNILDGVFRNKEEQAAAEGSEKDDSGLQSDDGRTRPEPVYCPSIDLLPDSLWDKRVVTTGGYVAYLKIAEGCSKRCSYCIIPYLRGNYRSFPMEDLIKEAEMVAAGGARELILVAQETTVYGLDLYGRKMLPDLLTRLCRIEGLSWIRILYCYPEEITEDLIDVIAREPKVCHYLDIPVQHCQDRILEAMGRRTSRQDLTAMISRIRERIPDIVLRTSLITGFPGETEEEAQALLDFVDQMEFDRLGVFPYSAEEGTRAARMAGQIPEEVKEDRRDQIMALQQEISREKGQERIGSVMDVLIEGYLYEDDIYVGRTYMDAPGVDGSVFVHAQEELMSGDIVPVRITGSAEYDLMGDVIYEDEFA